MANTTEYVIVAGKLGRLYWTGSDSFTRFSDGAKKFASELSAKRALRKVHECTGRYNLAIAPLAPPAAQKKPAKKASTA